MGRGIGHLVSISPAIVSPILFDSEPVKIRLAALTFREGEMDSMQAFAKGEANRGKEMMVFDWDGAATAIKESGAREASAGLKDDWEWTGGSILTDGKPAKSEDTYVFLASTWATPEIDIDGCTVPCYKMQSETDGWGSDTYWPESALKILNG